MDPELGPLFHRCPGNTLENQSETKKAFKVELSNRNPKFEWGLTVPKRNLKEFQALTGLKLVPLDYCTLVSTSTHLCIFYNNMLLKKDVFRLVTSVGQRKNSESPWRIEPQTFGFCASMLYHLVTNYSISLIRTLSQWHTWRFFSTIEADNITS